MKFTATKDNIRYLNCPRADITVLVWMAGPGLNDILRNVPNVTHLRIIGDDSIDNLEGIENLVHLQRLICHGQSKLKSIGSIQNCKDLREFYASHCGIESIEPLTNCSRLVHVDLSRNNISSVDGMEKLQRLKTLNIQSNRLKLVKAISSIRLRILDFGDNEIETLCGLENCRHLRELICSGNKLKNLQGIPHTLLNIDLSSNNLECLDGIQNLKQLRVIQFHNNGITSLEPLSGMEHIEYLGFRSNKVSDIQSLSDCPNIDYIDCELDSDLDLFHDVVNLNWSFEKKTKLIKRYCKENRTLLESPYTNDFCFVSGLKKSIDDAIKAVMTDQLPAKESELKPGDLSTKALKIIKDNTETCYHKDRSISYGFLVSRVIARINRSSNRKELLRILDQQIIDSRSSCSFGLFARTVSTLAGFEEFSDINITISDTDRIVAIIIDTKSKLELFDPVICRFLATRRLAEAGYDEQTIGIWVSAIE